MATVAQIVAGWVLIGSMLLLAAGGLIYSRVTTSGKRLLIVHWVLTYLLFAVALFFTFTADGAPLTPSSTYAVLAVVSLVVYNAAAYAVRIFKGTGVAPFAYAAALGAAALAAMHTDSTVGGRLGMTFSGVAVSLWACFVLYEYFTTKDVGFAFGVAGLLVSRIMIVGVFVFFGAGGLGWLDEVSEGIVAVFADFCATTIAMAYVTWAYSGDAGVFGHGYIDESMITKYDDEEKIETHEVRGLL